MLFGSERVAQRRKLDEKNALEEEWAACFGHLCNLLFVYRHEHHDLSLEAVTEYRDCMTTAQRFGVITNVVCQTVFLYSAACRWHLAGSDILYTAILSPFSPPL